MSISKRALEHQEDVEKLERQLEKLGLEFPWDLETSNPEAVWQWIHARDYNSYVEVGGNGGLAEVIEYVLEGCVECDLYFPRRAEPGYEGAICSECFAEVLARG